MKIIDWKAKGNLVRFYLGEDNLEKWVADDEDDIPYEHNRGSVYEEYLSGHVDLTFPFEYTVLEPKDDWRYQCNSPWCFNDFKARKCPIIVAIKNTDAQFWEDCFSEAVNNNKSIKIYMGDNVSSLVELQAKFKYEEGLAL